MENFDSEKFLTEVFVDPAIFELRPDYKAALITVNGIIPSFNSELAESMLLKAEQKANQLLAEMSVEEIPHIAAWRQAFTAFGAKPNRTRNSAEALIRRAQSGLPRINPLTDIYNAISVLHQIPIGGEDLTKYESAPKLIRANGNEPFDTIADGELVTEYPEVGEVIWCDSMGVTCRRWNWRQGKRTQLTNDSSSVLFILDALEPVELSQLNEICDELIDAVSQLGTEVKTNRLIISN